MTNFYKYQKKYNEAHRESHEAAKTRDMGWTIFSIGTIVSFVSYLFTRIERGYTDSDLTIYKLYPRTPPKLTTFRCGAIHFSVPSYRSPTEIDVVGMFPHAVNLTSVNGQNIGIKLSHYNTIDELNLKELSPDEVNKINPRFNDNFKVMATTIPKNTFLQVISRPFDNSLNNIEGNSMYVRQFITNNHLSRKSFIELKYHKNAILHGVFFVAVLFQAFYMYKERQCQKYFAKFKKAVVS